MTGGQCPCHASSVILFYKWDIAKIQNFVKMKIIEVLKFNRELIKRLKMAGIRLEDADYVDLYSDYAKLLDRGEKISYIVAVLADRYGICERKVYELVKRFRSDIPCRERK